MKKIADLHIVVVGASGALGRAFARAANAEGASVSLAGRRDPELGLPFFNLDILSAQACDDFAEHLAKGDLPVDVVVNCTGIHHPPMSLARIRQQN